MLTIVHLFRPVYLPGIQRILQDVSHRGIRPPVAILGGVVGSHVLADAVHRPPLEVQREHLPHLHGLVLVHHKPSAALGNGLVVVADGSKAAAMEEAGLCPTDTANRHALPDLFTFQLGEHRQDADHSPAKRRGCIKVFVHGNKGAAVFQEHVLNQIQGILLGAGQPVQLPDQNSIALFRLHKGDQLLHTRTFQLCPGKTRIGDDLGNHPVLRQTVRL